MKKILLLGLVLLLISTVSAIRYVPYEDSFEEKYRSFMMEKQDIPAPPDRIMSDGRVYYYKPEPVVRTQRSYYKVGDVPVTGRIKDGSWDDGYHKGYFEGYYDGEYFQKYGWDGYYDYLDDFKSRTDPDRVASALYVFDDKPVQISVSPKTNRHDSGYRQGVIDGFNDGFRGLAYEGLNHDEYSLEFMQDAYPGTYEPVPYVEHRTFSSFPTYYPGMRGSVYYGFNY